MIISTRLPIHQCLNALLILSVSLQKQHIQILYYLTQLQVTPKQQVNSANSGDLDDLTFTDSDSCAPEVMVPVSRVFNFNALIIKLCWFQVILLLEIQTNILLFPTFPSSHHFCANFPNSKGLGPQIEMSRKITVVPLTRKDHVSCCNRLVFHCLSIVHKVFIFQSYSQEALNGLKHSLLYQLTVKHEHKYSGNVIFQISSS